MSWRSVVVVVGLLAAVSCGEQSDADDSNQPPVVTVLGTNVDSERPQPTIGSAVSTERD
jgi:hypothetical protein